MILDDNTISIDHEDLTSGEIEGMAIPLTSFKKPGRQGFIPLAVFLTRDAEGGEGLDLKLTMSDEQDGDYEDVPGSSISIPTSELEEGALAGWRIVPLGVKKPWFKVVATPQGSFSAGQIFAGVVREEVFPYEKGLYIDKGTVQG